MNLSTWDSSKPRKLRPEFSSGHIITEFNRTKQKKIASHILAEIEFVSKNVNVERDKLIDKYSSYSGSDIQFRNVWHTYSDAQVIYEEAEGEYLVYAHGHPLDSGNESCVREGMKCGDGDDADCEPGGCVIGKISFVRNKKWKYESETSYNNSVKVSYYLNGPEKITLKPVIRGKFNGLDITSPASKHCEIYLPPKYYFSEQFLDGSKKVRDYRLNLVDNPPTSDLIGLENIRDGFISGFITKFYPSKSEGYTSNILQAKVSENVRDNLITEFESLPSVWFDQCSTTINDIFQDALTDNVDNFNFILSCYNNIKRSFSNVIQVYKSSVKPSKIDYGKNEIARPVYSRLPGVSEAYRSDPLFSEDEKPAQWLTSGADEFFSNKKAQIDSFYEDYLDPDTCSPANLDWLAQHVGMFGNLWDTTWDKKTKVALIKNTFGWYDKNKEVEAPGVTTLTTSKGKVLKQFPFGPGSGWVQLEEEDNSLTVSLAEIGKGEYEESSLSLSSFFAFKEKKFNQNSYTLSLDPVDSIKTYDGKWNGLTESKGSLLTVAFLVSAFGLKSHTLNEMELVKAERKIDKNGQEYIGGKILKPRTGLRSSEIDAPPLWIYKHDLIQVGNESVTVDSTGQSTVVSGSDLVINNYPNQLVADVSRVCSVNESKNVFFRVPYYYNKNGSSWNKTKYIAEKWLPANLNPRVQYPHLSADLWSVGDAFFEPEIELINLT